MLNLYDVHWRRKLRVQRRNFAYRSFENVVTPRGMKPLKLVGGKFLAWIRAWKITTGWLEKDIFRFCEATSLHFA